MSKQIFEEMITKLSPSGFEDNLQQFIAKTYKNENNRFEVSEKGTLTAIYNENEQFSIELAAHADEISLIVDGYLSTGLLHVAKNGGIRPRLYVGCKVRILTTDNKVYYGSMGVKGFNYKKDETDVEDLYVDLGFKSIDEAKKYIPLGSYVIHDSDYRELFNNCISARAIDDRIGDYIIHEAAKLATQTGCKNKLYVTTTTGEENTGRGAYQASSIYKPNIFIAVDVTYAVDYPGADEPGDVKLGMGGVICHGSIVNRKLNELLEESAKELNLPIQHEVFAGRTGTDADTALKTNNGPAILLYSIPLRYMHSPAEVLNFDDAENMIKVLARFLNKVSSKTNLLPYEI